MYEEFTPPSLPSYTTTSPSSIASSGFTEAFVQPAPSRPPRLKMMKVVVVGTNGFAQFLATCLQSLTPYQFFILSQRPNTGLTNKGWQIIQTDYRNQNDLAFHLTGVDTVISTISGEEQLALIDAAAEAQVGRFVPSEFCGLPYLRQNGDPSENGRRAALARLDEHALRGRMSYTVFSFGLFYEHFSPGGLAASHINISGSLGGEGSCLVNMRNRLARLPYRAYAHQPHTQDHQHVPYVSMISARDAARYLVEALQVSDWPRQVTFCTERLSVQEVFQICQDVNGPGMQAEWVNVTAPRGIQDRRQTLQNWQLSNIAHGVFDLSNANPPGLNGIMVDIDCEGFLEWLQRAWTP